jgi:hypothetical protein
MIETLGLFWMTVGLAQSEEAQKRKVTVTAGCKLR